MKIKLFTLMLFLLAANSCRAQLLSAGIIDTNRSKDWTGVGIAGGIPSGTWTQCGSVISAGSSAATITSALAGCAGQNKYVLLGPGTFNITGITFNNTGHVVLRGSGSNSTILKFSATASGCNGRAAFICNIGGDGTSRGQPQSQQVVHNWIGTFAKGSTQIQLDSVSGIIAGKSMVLLNQCDTGFSGATCSTGSAADNGGYWECALPWVSTGVGCTPTGEGSDGASWRGASANTNPAWQQEWALVTSVVGTTITLSKALDHPNWSLSQSPQAVVIQPLTQVGVENLTVDGSSLAINDGIYFLNAYQWWVSGVTVKNDGNKGVEVLDGVNGVVQNSYFFGNPKNYGDNAGVGIQGGNNLIQNNICHQRSLCVLKDGPSEGDVFAYNYDPAGFVSSTFTGAKYAYDTHSAGDNFDLLEGNIWPSTLDDDDHGTHLNQTRYRNFQWGWQSCVNGMCASAGVNTFLWSIGMPGSGRYSANIANVFGTPGRSPVYVDQTNLFSVEAIYELGAGNGALPADPKTYSTMLNWGNTDTKTGLSLFCSSGHTNFASCPNGSEIPTGAPTYPNAVPTVGDVGQGQGAFPASFYLSSKPGWFGSVTWPPIGPDVSSGNVAQCTGGLGTISQGGLPTSDATKCSTGATQAAWGGRVNAIPSMAYYLSLGGLPDGSGPALAFDGSHYASGVSTVATPTFSPIGASYLATQSVTISDATGGAALVYCIDTTNTCVPSTAYSGAVSISATEYLRAQGTLAGSTSSAIASATYQIGLIGDPFQTNLDSGNANFVNFTPSTTPAGTNGFSVTNCLVFIATADNTKQWGCAIYTDTGTGKPSTLLCSFLSSAANPTVPAPVNGWNSVALSGCGTLTNSKQYWLAQITGSNTQSEGYSLNACPNSSNSGWTVQQGSTAFPASAGTITVGGACYSLYATISAVTPTAPAVTLTPGTPPSLTFGDQSTGTTSSAQTITYQNSGTANLHTTAVAASSGFNNAGTGTCTGVPFDLAAGASCTVNATFSPSVLGVTTGTLTFTNNAANSPQTMALSGNGVAVPSPVVAPTFSPIAGTYTSTQSVAISTTTTGASIVYTTDGSTPTVSSDCVVTNGTLLANGGTVSVSATTTLTAIGCKATLTASASVSAAYVIPGQVSAPQFLLNFLTLTITSATARATICYTTNGTAPTTDGAGNCLTGTTLQNGGSVVVTSGTTITAVATKNKFTDSGVVTAIVFLGPAPGAATFGQPTIIIFY